MLMERCCLRLTRSVSAFHAAESVESVGDSPILRFYVKDVMSAIAALKAMGAKLEERVREPAFYPSNDSNR